MKQIVDPALLRRFDRQGPRYTSYPTAPCFHDGYTGADFAADLIAEPVGRGLSLYVHLPYCDTLCYFCACNMKVSNDRSTIADYLDALYVDLRLTAKRLHGQIVRQIHWGGGTPTHLTPAEIVALMGVIREAFTVATDAEVSVEIDPRGLTDGHLDALHDAGFNRASMGVQDTDPAVQRAINRIQPHEVTAFAIDGLRARGVGSINVDLIYGLPHQTLETINRTVDDVMRLDPDRLAVFNFAIVPWMFKHQRLIDGLPRADAEEKIAIFSRLNDRLDDAGYAYVGMDHFAKASDSLVIAQRSGNLRRNFQGYSTHEGLSIVACGTSAISELAGSYAQNVKHIGDYKRRIREEGTATERGLRLTPDDQLRRRVIMDLMCNFAIYDQDFSDLLPAGQSFSSYFGAEIEGLKPFTEFGLIERTSDGLVVSNEGRMIIRNMAMVFDAWLPKLAADQARFSRTV